MTSPEGVELIVPDLLVCRYVADAEALATHWKWWAKKKYRSSASLLSWRAPWKLCRRHTWEIAPASFTGRFTQRVTN